MSKHYEQRKFSNERYEKTQDRIVYRVPKGGKEELHRFVKEVGYPSANQFISDAVEYYKDAVVSGEAIISYENKKNSTSKKDADAGE